MEDYITTARGVVGITFDDNTQVRVSEHSELLIDDFVYDPETTSGALGIRVSFGTVKYASGNIAHNNPDTVNITTPSSTIAVRGTAFSMTVDETGGSLIILLPNPDGTVGSIEVLTNMGMVVLDKAFQATLATNMDRRPTVPAILKINESMIGNLLIISPPKEIVDDILGSNAQDFLEENKLDISFLDNNTLNDDLLVFSELDINELDAELLGNILDLMMNGDNIDGNFEGYNPTTSVYTFINDPTVRVVRAGSSAVFDIRFEINSGINAVILQKDDVINITTLEGESTNTVRIEQQ